MTITRTGELVRTITLACDPADSRLALIVHLTANHPSTTKHVKRSIEQQWTRILDLLPTLGRLPSLLANHDPTPLRSPSMSPGRSGTSDPTWGAVASGLDLVSRESDLAIAHLESAHSALLSLTRGSGGSGGGIAARDHLSSAQKSLRSAVAVVHRLESPPPVDQGKRQRLIPECLVGGHDAAPRPRRGLCESCYAAWRRDGCPEVSPAWKRTRGEEMAA